MNAMNAMKKTTHKTKGMKKDGPQRAAEAGSPPRIVGGSMRGRTLAFVPAARTRPMKDRVRETLFNLIGPVATGSTAIDLFAGTGALGFEALSRGAAKALFVERHFPTGDAIRRSARDLGVADRVDVRGGDVLVWARRLPEIDRSSPWLVFVSPPWRFFADDSPERGPLLELVAALCSAAPAGSTIVVESDGAFDGSALPEPGSWTPREILPAVLHFWRAPG
jgi:16S rRNA (guanine966-N2)-methyltransferase